MKNLNFIFFALMLILTSCNSSLSEIPIEKVLIDDETSIYTYKDTKKLVTGNVISSEPNNDGVALKVVRKVVNGYRVSVVSYYPSGQKECEYSCNDKGEIDGNVTWYHENGQIDEVRPFKNGIANGTALRYNENGKKILEQIYENDEIVKEYKFDDNGNKIIPASESLELVQIETGFYRYVDANSNQILYQPTVLSKWKNKSDNPISERITFEGIFIDDDKNEELATDREYFQGVSDAPLQPNLSRQARLQSSVGSTNPYAIENLNVSCKITINGTTFKTVKIENKLLHSNRIQ